MDKKQLLAELARLDKGRISVKKIKGKEYHYLQWSEAGKRKIRYIPHSVLGRVCAQLEQRAAIEAELARREMENPASVLTFKCLGVNWSVAQPSEPVEFKDHPLVDQQDQLLEFMNSKKDGRVCLAYGDDFFYQDRFIKWFLNQVDPRIVRKMAIITLTSKDSAEKLIEDLNQLKRCRYKVVIVDNINLVKDFWECAPLIPRLFADAGMKILMIGGTPLVCNLLGHFYWGDNAVHIQLPFLHHYQVVQVAESICRSVRVISDMVENQANLTDKTLLMRELEKMDAKSRLGSDESKKVLDLMIECILRISIAPK